MSRAGEVEVEYDVVPPRQPYRNRRTVRAKVERADPEGPALSGSTISGEQPAVSVEHVGPGRTP